ncbi:hypothetical protein [Actinoplanes sp. NPDC049265]|uniref:hypothetical protein n=1 Tax=Actinoplanes sp. NPDC049265 TaxID=3363902 RepID=UPI00371E3C78
MIAPTEVFARDRARVPTAGDWPGVIGSDRTCTAAARGGADLLRYDRPTAPPARADVPGCGRAGSAGVVGCGRAGSAGVVGCGRAGSAGVLGCGRAAGAGDRADVVRCGGAGATDRPSAGGRGTGDRAGLVVAGPVDVGRGRNLGTAGDRWLGPALRSGSARCAAAGVDLILGGVLALEDGLVHAVDGDPVALGADRHDLALDDLAAVAGVGADGGVGAFDDGAVDDRAAADRLALRLVVVDILGGGRPVAVVTPAAPVDRGGDVSVGAVDDDPAAGPGVLVGARTTFVGAGDAGRATIVACHPWVAPAVPVRPANPRVTGTARLTVAPAAAGRTRVTAHAGITGNAGISGNTWAAANPRIAGDAGIAANPGVAGTAGDAGLAGHARAVGDARVAPGRHVAVVAGGAAAGIVAIGAADTRVAPDVVTVGAGHARVAAALVAGRTGHARVTARIPVVTITSGTSPAVVVVATAVNVTAGALVRPRALVPAASLVGPAPLVNAIAVVVGPRVVLRPGVGSPVVVGPRVGTPVGIGPGKVGWAGAFVGAVTIVALVAVVVGGAAAVAVGGTVAVVAAGGAAAVVVRVPVIKIGAKRPVALVAALAVSEVRIAAGSLVLARAGEVGEVGLVVVIVVDVVDDLRLAPGADGAGADIGAVIFGVVEVGTELGAVEVDDVGQRRVGDRGVGGYEFRVAQPVGSVAVEVAALGAGRGQRRWRRVGGTLLGLGTLAAPARGELVRWAYIRIGRGRTRPTGRRNRGRATLGGDGGVLRIGDRGIVRVLLVPVFVVLVTHTDLEWATTAEHWWRIVDPRPDPSSVSIGRDAPARGRCGTLTALTRYAPPGGKRFTGPCGPLRGRPREHPSTDST